jgi:four helix bundle protein
MRNFKNLLIWQNAFEIVRNAYNITNTFPASENWGLVQQINRAAVSIPSNIAEGNSRTSDKDKNRYIEIALGSTFELETQFLISKELQFGDQALIDKTLLLITEEEKMLTAFKKALSL